MLHAPLSINCEGNLFTFQFRLPNVFQEKSKTLEFYSSNIWFYKYQIWLHSLTELYIGI